MGALCGKEDHFDALAGKGNVLGAAPATSTSGNNKQGQSHNTAGAVTSSGPSVQPLPTDTGPRRQDDAQRREAMLKAAEDRNKAAATRGGSGKLSSQLAAQKSDGGRAQQALQDADNKNNDPLRWD
ncbi:hypothetical protein OIO90_001383 [Microbotryomycetes sp. JL221]|nr:hypothetical protein OIO90_001383 [Microbotryomycetes sp. JL221]